MDTRCEIPDTNILPDVLPSFEKNPSASQRERQTLTDLSKDPSSDYTYIKSE
jgi:hypothetical protein